jgi:hypothetical protein
MKTRRIFKKCAPGALSCILVLYAGLLASDFSFVVIGDTRPPYGTSSYSNFTRQIERINSFHPAFMINCGDLIFGYGGPATENVWSEYLQVITAVKVPYYQLPGNHDIFSKKAESVYNELFKKPYYSFSRGGCHFVLLDNTENGIWGYIGDAQFKWLAKDLSLDTCSMKFVFMHLPPWIKEKIDRKYYAFWKETLHPLFRSHKVKAVFGGHIHSYGPTRRFDGIDYYITGGGGAELSKWYKAAGGDFHFILVKVQGGSYSHSIVTDNDVLNEEQADVSRNVEFSRDNAGVMVMDMEKTAQSKNEQFTISLCNPSKSKMTGHAQWSYDTLFFAIKPFRVSVDVSPGHTKNYSFRVKILNDSFYTKRLPSLSFMLQSDSTRYLFSKDLVFHRQMTISKETTPKIIDGDLHDWQKEQPVILSDAKSRMPLAEVMAAYDKQWLYVAARVFDKNISAEHEGPMTFLNDAFVLAVDRANKRMEHGNDDLQLEISKTRNGVAMYNRAKGEEVDIDRSGIRTAVTGSDSSATIVYEIALPASFLEPMRLKKGTTFGINFGLCNADGKGKTELTAWAPGIEIDGLDESFQSQLHFAGAVLK